MRRKNILCIVISIILLTAILSAFSSQAADIGYTQTGPTIYINDEPWYKYSRYYLAIVSSENYTEYYVPISLFEYFPGYEVTFNRAKTEYLINDKINERYISFNISFGDNNHLALTYTGSGMTVKTMKLYGGELYVPIDLVAEVMELSWSIFKSQNDSRYVTLRVCNGSEKKTFEELIKANDPQMLKIADTSPPDTTTSPPDTTIDYPPNPIQPGEDVDTVSRTVYLTFEDGPNEYTEEILNILDEYGYKATFFLVGKNLTDYTETIVRMAASGHSIGLHTMTSDENLFKSEINAFISELEEENNILMRIIKQKSRIIRAPGGSYTKNFYINNDSKELIQNEGYVIWDWNIDSYDNGLYWYKNVTERVVVNLPKIVKSVVRLRSTAVTLQTLPEILEFIKSHENYTVKSIMASDPEVNFAGYYD